METTIDSITLSWNKPRDDGGSPITGYVLEKRDKGKDRWTAACQTTISDVTFRVTGLKENHEYEFRVAALNAAGQSPYSSSSDGIFALPPPCMLCIELLILVLLFSHKHRERKYWDRLKMNSCFK